MKKRHINFSNTRSLSAIDEELLCQLMRKYFSDDKSVGTKTVKLSWKNKSRQRWFWQRWFGFNKRRKYWLQAKNKKNGTIVTLSNSIIRQTLKINGKEKYIYFVLARNNAKDPRGKEGRVKNIKFAFKFNDNNVLEQIDKKLIVKICKEQVYTKQIDNFKAEREQEAKLTKQVYPQEKYINPIFRFYKKTTSFFIRLLQKIGLKKTKVKNYLVQNYGGETVSDYLRKPDKEGKARNLSFPQRIKLCSSIINELTEIHKKGVRHRDVHFENILINNDKIKFIDFGFAKKVEDREFTNIWLNFCYAPNIYWYFDKKNTIDQFHQHYANTQAPNKTDIFNLAMHVLIILSNYSNSGLAVVQRYMYYCQSELKKFISKKHDVNVVELAHKKAIKIARLAINTVLDNLLIETDGQEHKIANLRSLLYDMTELDVGKRVDMQTVKRRFDEIKLAKQPQSHDIQSMKHGGVQNQNKKGEVYAITANRAGKMLLGMLVLCKKHGKELLRQESFTRRLSSLGHVVRLLSQFKINNDKDKFKKLLSEFNSQLKKILKDADDEVALLCKNIIIILERACLPVEQYPINEVKKVFSLIEKIKIQTKISGKDNKSDSNKGRKNISKMAVINLLHTTQTLSDSIKEKLDLRLKSLNKNSQGMIGADCLLPFVIQTMSLFLIAGDKQNNIKNVKSLKEFYTELIKRLYLFDQKNKYGGALYNLTNINIALEFLFKEERILNGRQHVAIPTLLRSFKRFLSTLGKTSWQEKEKRHIKTFFEYLVIMLNEHTFGDGEGEFDHKYARLVIASLLSNFPRSSKIQQNLPNIKKLVNETKKIKIVPNESNEKHKNINNKMQQPQNILAIFKTVVKNLDSIVTKKAKPNEVTQQINNLKANFTIYICRNFKKQLYKLPKSLHKRWSKLFNVNPNNYRQKITTYIREALHHSISIKKYDKNIHNKYFYAIVNHIALFDPFLRKEIQKIYLKNFIDELINKLEQGDIGGDSFAMKLITKFPSELMPSYCKQAICDKIKEVCPNGKTNNLYTSINFKLISYLRVKSKNTNLFSKGFFKIKYKNKLANLASIKAKLIENCPQDALMKLINSELDYLKKKCEYKIRVNKNTKEARKVWLLLEDADLSDNNGFDLTLSFLIQRLQRDLELLKKTYVYKTQSYRNLQNLLNRAKFFTQSENLINRSQI